MTATNDADIRLGEASARLILMSFATAVVLAVAGYWPTRALVGPGGAGAMLLGIGLALLATLAGLLPVLWSLRLPPSKRAGGLLTGMAVRFVLVLGLLLTVLLSCVEQKLALAVWTVIGHVALVVVDMFGILRYAGTARRCIP